MKLTMLLILTCLLTLPLAAKAAPPAVSAEAALLLDVTTGQILWEKNGHKRQAPASTTKVLTALLALEHGQLTDTVTVSRYAAATPGSRLQLYAGQTITLQELLLGLLLRSGNDAAVAIAEHVAGSETAFVRLMNERAAALGARESHFANPHGLSAAGHYSTAFDLAWLSRSALAHPAFAAMVGSRTAMIDWQEPGGTEHSRSLRNTNKLLSLSEDADGIKTGTTGEAGPCLIASATRDNQQLIAVVLHDGNRWYDALKLLEYGFREFRLYDYAPAGYVLDTLPVENGLAPVVSVLTAAPAALVVPAAAFPELNVSIALPEKIKAPVYQGQTLGTLIIRRQGQLLATTDLVASGYVGEATWSHRYVAELWRNLRYLAACGLL